MKHNTQNTQNTSTHGLVAVHGGSPSITIAYAHDGPATATTADTDIEQHPVTGTARISLADNTTVVIILLIAAVIGTVAAVHGAL